MTKAVMIFSVLLALSIAVSPVSAQTPTTPTSGVCHGGAANSPICKVGDDDPVTGQDGIIMKAVNIVSYIIGFVSVLMIIIAGIKFATSNGGSEGVASARNTILYAFIGLAIAASARIIVSFVISQV